jgi:TonB family protein
MGKLVITTTTSSLSYVQTKKGTYREGDLDRKLALLLFLEKSFVRPVPVSEKSYNTLDVALRMRPMGTTQLPCFTLRDHSEIPANFNDPAYCLEDNRPILRIGSFPDDPHQFVRNSVGKFQDRYVPVDIMADQGEKPDLAAHVDLLKQIATVDPADFKPGPKAILEVPSRITMVLPEGMMDKMIETNHLHPISRPQPEYPAVAKAAQVHGTVKMKATIGTDGRVDSLYVIKGPPMLRPAAVDAVWQWRFEPPFAIQGPAQILAIITVRL